MISVIIPVYNEKENILKIIKKVENVKIKKEIVIVDDYSIDGTRDLLKKIKNPDINIFYHKKNCGKGRAVRTGLSHAKGDIIIIQDADLEYDPNDYYSLIKPIQEGKTDVVYGSRYLKKFDAKHFVKEGLFVVAIHYVGNKLLTKITQILYNTNITDMETCYKVFKKDAIKDIKLRAKRFDLEPELTAKFLKRGYKICEVPISYKARGFKEGKKITWKDGIKALYYLIKYRFID